MRIQYGVTKRVPRVVVLRCVTGISPRKFSQRRNDRSWVSVYATSCEHNGSCPRGKRAVCSSTNHEHVIICSRISAREH